MAVNRGKQDREVEQTPKSQMCIRDRDYRVYCTLVQGERLAILWDTGQGKQDLSAWVAAQVSTPCIAVSYTHLAL